MDAEIVLSKYGVKTDKPTKVDKMNGQTIGVADHCCDECAKYKDKGVWLIGVDAEKSDASRFEGFYRTGQLSLISNDSEWVKAQEKFIISLKDGSRLMFIDENVGKEFKIFE